MQEEEQEEQVNEEEQVKEQEEKQEEAKNNKKRRTRRMFAEVNYLSTVFKNSDRRNRVNMSTHGLDAFLLPRVPDLHVFISTTRHKKLGRIVHCHGIDN